ncbi:MAG: hypothetical protein ACI4D8_02815 [Wujia sp.]
MPRLLRKNIYKASIITAILGLIVVIIFVGSILHHGKIAIAFNVINLFLLIAELSNDTTMLRFELPDYMYIAPYSREQREGLIRKGMLYKLMAIYMTILLIAVAPILVYSIINNIVMCTIICIAEAVIIFTTLYNRMYLRYLIKVRVLPFVVIELVSFFQYVIFVSIASYSNHSGESNHISEVIKYHLTDVILLGCLMLMGIIIAVFCRVKCFKPMIYYLADYENFRELNEKK